jgi:hypothetical protein
MVTTMQATRKRGKRQPRKDEQQAQQEAVHQQETPAAELPGQQAPQGEQLAKPATAEQNGGPALRPTQPFAMRFWIMTDSENYLLTPVRRKSPEDIGGWNLQKYSDGTTYCVADGVEGLSCDCPGCVEHGPSCAQGRGCKHMRMIRALLSAMLEH